jgi:hypothetical protein
VTDDVKLPGYIDLLNINLENRGLTVAKRRIRLLAEAFCKDGTRTTENLDFGMRACFLAARPQVCRSGPAYPIGTLVAVRSDGLASHSAPTSDSLFSSPSSSSKMRRMKKRLLIRNSNHAGNCNPIAVANAYEPCRNTELIREHQRATTKPNVRRI